MASNAASSSPQEHTETEDTEKKLGFPCVLCGKASDPISHKQPESAVTDKTTAAANTEQEVK